MPLTRKLPKRGFNNIFRKEYAIVNIERLGGFEKDTVVNYDLLMDMGLIKRVKNSAGLKVLGDGKLDVALTVEAAKFSESAKEAIEKAGGKVVVK